MSRKCCTKNWSFCWRAGWLKNHAQQSANYMTYWVLVFLNVKHFFSNKIFKVPVLIIYCFFHPVSFRDSSLLLGHNGITPYVLIRWWRFVSRLPYQFHEWPWRWAELKTSSFISSAARKTASSEFEECVAADLAFSLLITRGCTNSYRRDAYAWSLDRAPDEAARPSRGMRVTHIIITAFEAVELALGLPHKWSL